MCDDLSTYNNSIVKFKVNITYGFFYMEMDETHKKFIQWMKWQKL